MKINLTDASISCGICGEKFSVVEPHKFFASSEAIDALAFNWFGSVCDVELKLKFNGEFKHVDGDVKPANPTNGNFCCCNDAKFCKFWKFNIFCTTKMNGIKKNS